MALVPLGERHAGPERHLQGPHNLVPVTDMEGGGAYGVHLGQPVPQAARAVGHFFLEQLPPQAPVSWRPFPQAVGKGANVQPRPAHDERHAPFRVQPGDLLQRQPTVQADVEGLVRLDEIDQPMGHAIPLRRRRLVRADVHAAVHLRRVSRENFGAERLRDLDRHPTLPDGRRPDEKDYRKQVAIHVYPLVIASDRRERGNLDIQPKIASSLRFSQ